MTFHCVVTGLQKSFPFIHACLVLNDFMNIVHNALFILFSLVAILPILYSL